MTLPLPGSQALKLAAAVALALAVFAFVHSALGDADGPIRVAIDRYLGFLDRQLRAVFLRVPAARIAAIQAALVLVVALLRLVFSIPYWYLPLVVILVAPAIQLERWRRARVLEIERQLDSFMLGLANALKSIPGVTAAFQSVAETSPLPIREELELCNREMRVGSTLDEALLHMAARVQSSRLDATLVAIVLGRQIGGNLPRVLESTASSVREMSRLEGVLRTKTSEAKMQLYVIGAAPLFLLVVMAFISPGFFDPLSQSSAGYMVGIAAASCWSLALVLARKVLSVSL